MYPLYTRKSEKSIPKNVNFFFPVRNLTKSTKNRAVMRDKFRTLS